MMLCEDCQDALATMFWLAVPLCASCWRVRVRAADEAEAMDDERRSLRFASDEELEKF